jgi:2'-5' RNA ligase
MEDIDAALQTVAAPRFEMFLEGVGYFGRPKAARSIHVGIAQNPALAHLRDKIESALVRAGFEPEERKFSAHVTLARLQDAPASRIMEFVSGNNLFREGPIAVDRFALMSSFHGGNGAIYRAEQYYALGPPGGTDTAASWDGDLEGD